MDVYAIVTEKIINLLEQGVVPWRRPWISTGPAREILSARNRIEESAIFYFQPRNTCHHTG